MATIVRTLSWLCLAGLLVGQAQAEQADRRRPIQIEADSLRMDDHRKIAVYEGNVVLGQGTMTITADRIDVHQDDQGMASGEATGQPVQFRQKLEGRDVFLEARAGRIEYDARTETIRLMGNAYIAQGNDELRGGVIVYDLRSERYQAQGATGDGKQGRVRAMIRPRNLPESPVPDTSPMPAGTP